MIKISKYQIQLSLGWEGRYCLKNENKARADWGWLEQESPTESSIELNHYFVNFRFLSLSVSPGLCSKNWDTVLDEQCKSGIQKDYDLQIFWSVTPCKPPYSKRDLLIL